MYRHSDYSKANRRDGLLPFSSLVNEGLATVAWGVRLTLTLSHLRLPARAPLPINHLLVSHIPVPLSPSTEANRHSTQRAHVRCLTLSAAVGLKVERREGWAFMARQTLCHYWTC